MQRQSYLLTDDLRVVLEHARREAEHRHNIYLDVEHLMLGLLRHYSGPAHDLFRQHDVDTNALYDQVADSVGMERSSPIDLKGYAKVAQRAFDRAQDEARALGHVALDTGHMLLSLMQEADGAVHDVAATLPFDADGVRAALRAHEAPRGSTNRAPVYLPTQRRNDAPASQSDEPAQVVLVPTRPQRKPAGEGRGLQLPNWILIAGGLVALMAYLYFVLPGATLFTFVFVLVGWVFSVTLHEFGHAAVAYIGGDHTVREKGYLSFNPLKYTHPMLSIALPLVFLAIGGIGLPGGAVYIERHRLKNKWWGAAVSAAGPAANLMLAVLLAVPFITGIVDVRGINANLYFEEYKDDFERSYPNLSESEIRERVGLGPVGFWDNPTIWTAVAFLIMLQFTAVFFNLIPIPPLDGFGIIEPYLDRRTREQFRQIGMMGIFLIFFLFLYIRPVSEAFWDGVYETTDSVDVPGWMITEGHRDFMFWRIEE